MNNAKVKLVNVTETLTPFVKVVKNLNEYQVSDVVSKYTKQVFVVGS